MPKYGYTGFLGLGKESVWGTAVARTAFLPFLDAEIRESQGEIISAPSRDRYERQAEYGRYSVGLSALVEGRPDSIGLLFLALMGNVTSQQQGTTTAYLHTFTHGNVLKYLSGELKYGTADISELITSLAVDEISLDWAFELLTMRVSGIGQKPSRVTPSTSTWEADEPFVYHEGTITLGGSVAKVRGGRVRLVNNLDRDDYGSGERFLLSAEPGTFQAFMEFELNFEDMSWVQKFWGGAAVTEPQVEPTTYAANVKFVGDTIAETYKYTLEIDAPKMLLTNVGKPVRAQAKIIQRLSARCLMDTKVCDIKLTNKKISY